jgi:hypothetical protein
MASATGSSVRSVSKGNGCGTNMRKQRKNHESLLVGEGLPEIHNNL